MWIGRPGGTTAQSSAVTTLAQRRLPMTSQRSTPAAWRSASDNLHDPAAIAGVPEVGLDLPRDVPGQVQDRADLVDAVEQLLVGADGDMRPGSVMVHLRRARLLIDALDLPLGQLEQPNQDRCAARERLRWKRAAFRDQRPDLRALLAAPRRDERAHVRELVEESRLALQRRVHERGPRGVA